MEVNAEVKKQKYQISVSYLFPNTNLSRDKDSSNKNDISALIKFGGGFFSRKSVSKSEYHLRMLHSVNIS